MDRTRVIILGYGIRGRVYAQYAVEHPDALEVVAVADPVASVPSDAPFAVFRRWEDALDAGLAADAVVVSLPDRLHCAAAVRALSQGYHLLLEKPIGCSWEECLAIRRAQRAARRLVLTGYVLRYSGFWRTLRETVRSGVIGRLVSIHHLVAVSYGKAAHAFCRGNWAVEARSTGMLVTKCTHDFDLIDWWTYGRACRRVSSFGTLTEWRPGNRPEGAAERCAECPERVRAECPFDARRLYCERTDLRYHFADESDAAMRAVVRDSPYGRCVYACGNDAVDHQTAMLEYDDGLTVTLEMESLSQRRCRETRFYGTRGEIFANERRIEVRPFLGETRVVVPEQHGAHGGGDREIMTEFLRMMRTASSERYNALMDASLESHRLAFMAERSRKTGRTCEPGVTDGF